MSILIKTVILFLSIVVSTSASAQLVSQENPYYGEDFYREMKAGLRDRDIVMRLKVILRVSHTEVPGGFDEMGTSCGKGKCYQHTAIGYGAARVFLLGNYYLVKDGNEYAVRDLYCDNLKTRADFKGDGLGPGRVPDNTVINVEHTWPQSRFSNRYPKEMQKSDLHHLFPTDSQLNSVRGNYKFGEVVRDSQELKCPVSRVGQGDNRAGTVFEPPKNHRGNVARALFYFSVKYDLPIDPNEEATLKKWNKEDPVDEDEMNRNNVIFNAQKSRNPFIDYPELSDLVSDF